MNEGNSASGESTSKAIDAISALRKKGSDTGSDSGTGADLMSIVAKLSRNRSKASKSSK